jgi:hypothetical protein
MNAAALHRRPTSAIVTALSTQITALQVTAPFTPGAAFDRVELFDSEDLIAAFQYLLITQQRVCVIVPLTERHEALAQNMKLIVKRSLPVALLISDRVIGNRKTALWGDQKTPGAMGLMELVLPAVTGQLLANPSGVVSAPVSTSVMSVKDTNQKLPNRITVVLELNCRGGRLEAATSPVV